MTNLAPYDFSRQPVAADFRYYVTGFGDDYAPEVTAEVIEPALAETAGRFGIETSILEPWTVPEDAAEPAHVLVGPVDVLNMTRSQRAYLFQLGRSGVKANVVSAIPLDSSQLQRSGQTVRQQDAQLRVNTIYPDSNTGEFRTPSARDVADNQVCETFRVKYEAEQITDLRHKRWLELAQKAAGNNFDWLRRLYTDLDLFHRAPTDGAVMVKTDYGWLSSQTKTDKRTMSVATASLILPGANHDRIQYVGDRLPTSDAPELLSMIDELVDAHAIMPAGPKVVAHFHDNEVVRGGKFADIMGSEVLEYGVAASGVVMARDLMKILDDNPEGGLVVPEHGVVWAGRSVSEFTRFLSNTLGKLVPEALV